MQKLSTKNDVWEYTGYYTVNQWGSERTGKEDHLKLVT